MFERVHFRHCLGAHAEQDRATLHIDNWMVSIFSCRGCGQANGIVLDRGRVISAEI